jgi:hypothetical protein
MNLNRAARRLADFAGSIWGNAGHWQGPGTQGDLNVGVAPSHACPKCGFTSDASGQVYKHTLPCPHCGSGGVRHPEGRIAAAKHPHPGSYYIAGAHGSWGLYAESGTPVHTGFGSQHAAEQWAAENEYPLA